MDNELIEWMDKLSRKPVTENMMRWMTTFETVCDRDCCYSPDCAVISCSNCFTKLTSLCHPLERFVCMECCTVNAKGDFEICGPMFCSQCFDNRDVLHFHNKFCRVTEFTGQHLIIVRNFGVAEQRTLVIDDLVSWECSGDSSADHITSCCICCEDFSPSGPMSSRRVCPPGCSGGHDDCLFDSNKGWVAIPGAAYCGECAMQRYQVEGRLLHCRSEGVKSKFYPSYCQLCDHLEEMAKWRQDFEASFALLIAGFQQSSLVALTLPVEEARSLLHACGSLPSCAVPASADKSLSDGHHQQQQALEQGVGEAASSSVTATMTYREALDLLVLAAKKLHPQPYIRDEVDKAAAPFYGIGDMS
jgi:hypothetical protein